MHNIISVSRPVYPSQMIPIYGANRFDKPAISTVRACAHRRKYIKKTKQNNSDVTNAKTKRYAFRFS